MSHIIFDIDGTLANASHRMAYITNPDEPKNWDAFFDKVDDDAPIPEMWEILTGLALDNNRIIFSTGRPEKLREKSYNWLMDVSCVHRCLAARHWLAPNRGPILYMREEGDRRSSAEVKRDHLQSMRRSGLTPKIAFEDRKADADMWRSEGLRCLHVEEGLF